MTPRSIPVEWILAQIDQWVAISVKIGPGKMSDAASLRAEHYMELLEAWKHKHEPPQERQP